MHDHTHNHNHGKGAPRRLLYLALGITLGYAFVELLGGWWAGSLTLMSDAGHMFADSLALGMATFAAIISSRPPSHKHSYGLGRAEVIGAWVSSLFLLAIVIGILVEAIKRLQTPEHVTGSTVVVVATIGLVVNILVAWILSRGERTLNIRAALVHVMGDLLGSVAAIISGAVIYYTGWTTIDPILSIFICVLILFSSLRILRESLHVLMEGVPQHLTLSVVGTAMAKVPQVKSVHDLHIWTLSSGSVVLSAHIKYRYHQRLAASA